MDEITKQIAHSLKTTSISLHQPDSAASHDEANHTQVESIAGISANHQSHISQNAAESHHRGYVLYFTILIHFNLIIAFKNNCRFQGNIR